MVWKKKPVAFISLLFSLSMQLSTNLVNSSVFMFCVMLHDMTNVKISVGLQRLMGYLDQVYWKENFDAIVADDSDDVRRLFLFPLRIRK